MVDIDKILRIAIEKDASDIHLIGGIKPCLRVRRDLVDIDGFDALTETYVNMVESGIIDPAKVTRSALQNATSVASTLLTTESVVADIKEDTPAPAMPAGGMGMM